MKYRYCVLLLSVALSFWSMYSMRIADICNDQNEDVIVISSESSQELNRVNEITSYQTVVNASCGNDRKEQRSEFDSQEDVFAHIKQKHNTPSKEEIITAFTEKIEKKQNKNGKSRIEAEALNARVQLLITPLDLLAEVSLNKDILDIHQKSQTHIKKYQQSAEVNICDQENQVSRSNKNKRSRVAKKSVETCCKMCKRSFDDKRDLDRHMASIHKACLTCDLQYDLLDLLISHFREEHPQKKSIIKRIENRNIRSRNYVLKNNYMVLPNNSSNKWYIFNYEK